MLFRSRAPYLARQGTAIGRAGRIEIDRDAEGRVWTGGRSITLVRGTLSFD